MKMQGYLGVRHRSRCEVPLKRTQLGRPQASGGWGCFSVTTVLPLKRNWYQWYPGGSDLSVNLSPCNDHRMIN